MRINGVIDVQMIRDGSTRRCQVRSARPFLMLTGLDEVDMAIRAVVVVSLVGILSGCGGGGSGGGGGGGGGGGVGAGGNPPTAIAFLVPPTDCTGASIAAVEILLSTNRTIPDACTQAANACVSFANATGLSLGIVNYSSTSTASPVAPGTYSVTATPLGTSGTLAAVGAAATDASCNSTLTGSANASGSITISSVDGSSVTGSYDVTVYGTHYSGSFTATVCSGGLPQTDNCLNWTGQGGTCTGTPQCI